MLPEEKVDSMLSSCVTNCSGEKDDTGNKTCTIISSEQEGIPNCSLAPFQTNSNSLENLQVFLASKEKALSETALRVLLRKRENLAYQLRNLKDEIAICDKNIRTILDVLHICLMRNFMKCVRQVHSNNLQDLWVDFLGNVHVDSSHHTENLPVKEVTGDRDIFNSNNGVADSISYKARSDGEYPKTYGNGRQMSCLSNSVDGPQSMDANDSFMLCPKNQDINKNTQSVIEVYHRQRKMATSANSNKYASESCLRAKEEKVDSMLSSCVTNCSGEKDDTGNKTCTIISSEQEGIPNCSLAPFQTNSNSLENLQVFLASKEKALSETALRVLLRKRENLAYQLRNLKDEIAICDKNIRTILDVLHICLMRNFMKCVRQVHSNNLQDLWVDFLGNVHVDSSHHTENLPVKEVTGDRDIFNSNNGVADSISYKARSDGEYPKTYGNGRQMSCLSNSVDGPQSMDANDSFMLCPKNQDINKNTQSVIEVYHRQRKMATSANSNKYASESCLRAKEEKVDSMLSSCVTNCSGEKDDTGNKTCTIISSEQEGIPNCSLAPFQTNSNSLENLQVFLASKEKALSETALRVLLRKRENLAKTSFPAEAAICPHSTLLPVALFNLILARMTLLAYQLRNLKDEIAICDKNIRTILDVLHICLMRNFMKCVRQVHSNNLQDLWVDFLGNVHVDSSHHTENLPVKEVTGDRDIFNSNIGVADSISYKARSDGEYPKTYGNGRQMSCLSNSVDGPQSMDANDSFMLCPKNQDINKNTQSVIEVYHRQRKMATSANSNKYASESCLRAKEEKVDSMLSSCVTNCSGEKDDTGNKTCTIISSEQEGIPNCSLAPFQTNSNSLENLQVFLASKEKALSETALRVLLRKRENLAYQLRNLKDEIAICDKNIRTILDDEEENGSSLASVVVDTKPWLRNDLRGLLELEILSSWYWQGRSPEFAASAWLKQHNYRTRGDGAATLAFHSAEKSFGGQDDLALQIEAVIDGCNDACLNSKSKIQNGTDGHFEDQGSPQYIKRKRLSEAILTLQDTCQESSSIRELDDICCRNNWILPTYHVSPSDDGFQARVTVKGIEFSGCSDMHSNPREARTSAAAKMIAKLQIMSGKTQ
ncbi:unnamed protein product [Ilex paraguariensis]|uniref:DRBM domain-containing protein n=1 Tax=Ilex paraguariensis TaxID=185542 RepID=A0ABC8T138_9AQUA